MVGDKVRLEKRYVGYKVWRTDQVPQGKLLDQAKFV